MNDTTSKAPVYAVACKPVAFVNSSHRRHWTFVDADALRKQRCAANEQFRLRFISTLDECAPTPNERHALIDALLDPDDERDQCAIVGCVPARATHTFRSVHRPLRSPTRFSRRCGRRHAQLLLNSSDVSIHVDR
jgi:hypothetical protein